MDAAPPSGTVTFLFTDVEGSTTLWEQFHDAMRAALTHHDALLRSAIEAAGGHIVKTTGDGVVAAFPSAAKALRASLAAQRGVQARAAEVEAMPPAGAGEPRPIALNVRMGLHTGAAEERDDDYFGPTLNRAARIMSVAHGGQILLSTATAELLRGHLPDGITLRDMGEHRLKGLLASERLLQVVAPDLRADFPPLASVTGHKLPAERDAFVGRLEPLADLTRRFATNTRLISVLGMGGTGKTRLVIRFGWASLGDFPGGAWFCDLASARSLDGIAHAVAQGLDVPLGKEDPVTQLGNAIASRGKCLLILDNFEQVARFAEESLGRWLDRAADARFLVTTREVLGLQGEEFIVLAPMSPADAQMLFRRRAEAAKPGFRPGAEDEAAIVPLVKLLDGLPLAIELAAARVRVMPPRTLLARMSERFKLLASTGGRLDRQSTLRAVFDWSWDMLALPEKSVLAQLSVFEGGFTLESVESVIDVSEYDDAPWAVDALQSLVQKSLVRQVADDRFDLLVSMKDYAAEHLRTPGRYDGSGPQAALAAEVRHGAHFAGMDESAATANECVELENFVVACRRAAGRGDAEVATQALECAWAGLGLRGPFAIGAALARQVRGIPGLGEAARARVDYVAGRALHAAGKDAEAHVRFTTSLALARDIGDRRSECLALLGLGECDSRAGKIEEAGGLLDAGLAVARELGDRTLQCDARIALGTLHFLGGQLGEARTHFAAALDLARQTRDRSREGRILANLGIYFVTAGDPGEGRSHYEAALAAAREVANRWLEGNTLCNLGLMHEVEGRYAEAVDTLESALTVAREIGNVRLECIVLCNLGMASESLARLDQARDYHEAALAVARELGDRRSEGQFLGYLGALHARTARFAAAQDCLDAGESLLRAVSDRISLAILLCSRAEAEHLAGHPDACGTALAEAETVAETVGASVDSELGHAIARVRNLLGREGPVEAQIPTSARC